jgi:hypothetical protein
MRISRDIEASGRSRGAPRPPGRRILDCRPQAPASLGGAEREADPQRGKEEAVGHCPECGGRFRGGQDICPACWERIVPGEPQQASGLRLVYATGALYEAEMIETLLENEGIPCLKVPGSGASLWPLAISSPLTWTRLYVHRENARAAGELIAEVTGGKATDA